MYWRDDALLLEGTRYSLRLAPWPSPSARRRAGGSCWERADPLAERLLRLWPRISPGEKPIRDPMGLVSGYQRRIEGQDLDDAIFWPVSYYFQRIPAEVRDVVDGYSMGRWAMLVFLSLDDRSFQLARSNTVLAYALAHHLLRAGAPERIAARVARRLLGLGQRELLDLLGFPSTESSRRILAKVDPRALSPSRLRRLRLVMADEPVARALRILPAITANALMVILDPVLLSLVGDAILLQLGGLSSEDCVRITEKSLAYSIKSAALYVKIKGLEARYLPFASLGQVARLRKDYEDYVLEKAYRRDLEAPDDDFPPPPFRGTEAIRPITSAHELQREAMEMRSCVRSYICDIKTSNAYFYRVLEPMRATLAVMNRGIFGRDRWVPADMLGPANAELPREVAEAAFIALFDSGPAT